MIIKSAGVKANTPALIGTLSETYTKSPLGNDLINGRIQGQIVGAGTLGIVGTIMGYVINKNWKSFKSREGKMYMTNLVTNISTIMWDIQKFYFSNAFPTRPAVILASIPLGTVTEVSHAMSQRDLKFRAVGGVFLADQEGGEESLRIVGRAWGKNRFVFLQMLDTLYSYGSSKSIDLYTEYLKSPLGMSSVPHLSEEELLTTTDLWEEFNENSISEGTTDHRATFPVITRQKIYANMFIETYEYTESVLNGIDTVEYVLFLRKYRTSPPIQFDSVAKGEGSDLTTKWYYKVDNENNFYNVTQKLDLLLGFGLSAAMIMYRTIVYLSTGRYSFAENLVSRFGIALNRTLEGDVDPTGAYTSEWTPGEKAELFGYKPCADLTGIAYQHCMLGVES
jgi:hypothetical protein